MTCEDVCLFVFNQANYSGYRHMSFVFDNAAIYGWTPCLYLRMFKLWLNLHHQLNYCRILHNLLFSMVITKNDKLSKLACLKMLYPSCIYSRAILFIWWHLFKNAHIRNKINNSCWFSRYMMQYAFNMLTKAWMYMKVYDEWICVYIWRGYLSQHCKPSRTKGENIRVQKQSTSLVSHFI